MKEGDVKNTREGSKYDTFIGCKLSCKDLPYEIQLLYISQIFTLSDVKTTKEITGHCSLI